MRGLNPAILSDIPIMARARGIQPNSGVDVGPALNDLLASVAGDGTGPRQTVLLDNGIYEIGTTISHPPNLVVAGAGPGTVLQQANDIPIVWDFQHGFLRSALADLQIQGQGRLDPLDFSLRQGIGVDLAQTQQVLIRQVQIWDFLTGLRMTDGVAFSSYHDIGPHVEVNRCTTGIYAREQINVSKIHDSRVFYSYGVADEGIGIDFDSPGSLEIQSCAIEAADTCIRARNTSATYASIIDNNFLEPGTNPTTLTVGSLYDIDVINRSDGTEMFHMRGNIQSGGNGDISLPTEGFVDCDAYSRAYFGARYSGAAVPKRNLVRNGAILYYNLPDALPNWFGGGVSPTLAQDTVNFVTGVRSLSVTAPAAINSSVFATFQVSDPGVQWVTCGIRYQVLPGNTGFFFTGSVGANNAQYTDPVPSGGIWQEAQVQVEVDPANRTGSISINPDSVAGTGTVLVDEVWAVAGRYAVPSGQYGERIEMLQAPIPIYAVTGVTGNVAWPPAGTIDITDLPNVLAPPLDDFSTAPEGVVGGIFRMTMSVPGAASTAVLSGAFYTTIGVPGAGATTIAASTQRVTAIFGQVPNTATVMVRDTTVSGVIILATGIATNFDIALIGWILQ